LVTASGAYWLYFSFGEVLFKGAPGRLLQGSLMRLVSLWWELPSPA
jgi:hypothetical protein